MYRLRCAGVSLDFSKSLKFEDFFKAKTVFTSQFFGKWCKSIRRCEGLKQKKILSAAKISTYFNVSRPTLLYGYTVHKVLPVLIHISNLIVLNLNYTAIYQRMPSSDDLIKKYTLE